MQLSYDKDSIEDQKLMWKLVIITDQLKRDEEEDKKIYDDDDG